MSRCPLSFLKFKEGRNFILLIACLSQHKILRIIHPNVSAFSVFWRITAIKKFHVAVISHDRLISRLAASSTIRQQEIDIKL